MDFAILENRIREKLRPHTDKIVNNNFTEHDILPGMFDLILSNQSELIKKLEKQADILGVISVQQNDYAQELKSLTEAINSNHSQTMTAFQSINNAALGQRKLVLTVLVVSIFSMLSSVTAIALLLLK